ncbi:MAG: acyl carrier protein [Clostridia bacterium]|jgi:acyl carrier protein|nr:acyl carrier protein [Clostridia bacterium]MDD3862890.1 acyl carrier protein [Clostridia bacterium]MDD4408660.1 acyl carrier protein [Clostridia bacterium]
MTLDKVKEIIASQLNIDAKKIKAEDKIIEDLGADSLDIVELLMKLEEEFGISIPDEDTSKMKTVGEILDVIKSKKTE